MERSSRLATLRLDHRKCDSKDHHKLITFDHLMKKIFGFESRYQKGNLLGK